jgi:hypothetical protein
VAESKPKPKGRTGCLTFLALVVVVIVIVSVVSGGKKVLRPSRLVRSSQLEPKWLRLSRMPSTRIRTRRA